MSKFGTLNLSFPLAGLNKRGLVSKQAPYSTPSAKNVRPVDVETERARGGSRPGTTRQFTEYQTETTDQITVVGYQHTGEILKVEGSPDEFWLYDNVLLTGVIGEGMSMRPVHTWEDIGVKQGDRIWIRQINDNTEPLPVPSAAIAAQDYVVLSCHSADGYGYPYLKIQDNPAGDLANWDKWHPSGNEDCHYSIKRSSGVPVRLLNSVTTIAKPRGAGSWGDDFASTMSDANWRTIRSTETVDCQHPGIGEISPYSGSFAFANDEIEDAYHRVGWALDKTLYPDASKQQMVQITLPQSPSVDASSTGCLNGRYYLYLGMDNEDPQPHYSDDAARACVAEIDFRGSVVGYGNCSIKVYLRTGSSTWHEVALSAPVTAESGGNFYLLFDPATDTLQARWGPNPAAQVSTTHTEITSSMATRNRVGFSMVQEETQQCIVDSFLYTYSPANQKPLPTEQLVVSTRGLLFAQDTDGELREVPALGTDSVPGLDNARFLSSVDRAGKLYIADHAAPVLEANGYVIPSYGGTGNARLCKGSCTTTTEGQPETPTEDDAGIAYFGFGLDINPDTDRVMILDTQDNLWDGVFTIKEVTGTYLELDHRWRDVDCWDWSSCRFFVMRAPKVYDPNEYRVTLWETDTYTAGDAADGLCYDNAEAVPGGIVGARIVGDHKGYVPVGCPIITLFRDRIVMGGAAYAPHVWYMSRAGNPRDFDYGQNADDFGRAIAGTTGDAGQVGEAITAIIPGSDDYLLFGTKHTLWIMRGDPAYGGSLDSLSRSVGVVDRTAWCHGPAGEVIFLAEDGLYGLPPGGGVPEPLSMERIPDELRSIDISKTQVTMTFDPLAYGVHIFLTATGSVDTTSHWYMDWVGKGFWPVDFADPDLNPTAVCVWNPDADKSSSVLMGCADSRIRRFDKTKSTDDATEGSAASPNTLTSEVVLGPIQLGASGGEGLLQSLEATFANESGVAGSVAWEVRVGNTPAEALTATVFATGSWGNGISYRSRPRARGAWMTLTLRSTSSWAMETIQGIVKTVGRLKLN